MAYGFSLPFHQGLGVAFKLLHSKLKFKKISKGNQEKKKCGSLGL